MRSKVLAAALVVLTVLGTGTWHVETDDPDFLPALTAHDHTTHHESFRSPAQSDSEGHCAICHWLQTFRASQVGVARLGDGPAADSPHRTRTVAPLASA